MECSWKENWDEPKCKKNGKLTGRQSTVQTLETRTIHNSAGPVPELPIWSSYHLRFCYLSCWHRHFEQSTVIVSQLPLIELIELSRIFWHAVIKFIHDLPALLIRAASHAPFFLFPDGTVMATHLVKMNSTHSLVTGICRPRPLDKSRRWKSHLVTSCHITHQQALSLWSCKSTIDNLKKWLKKMLDFGDICSNK